MPGKETRLGRALRRLYEASGARDVTEWAFVLGVSYGTLRHWMRAAQEPSWLRTLRTIKRVTGASWEELLG